jgi:hypothetical protein
MEGFGWGVARGAHALLNERSTLVTVAEIPYIFNYDIEFHLWVLAISSMNLDLFPKELSKNAHR